MKGQSKIDISEQKPSKFTELSDGYEMINNNSTMKIVLHSVTVMDNAMESSFYSTRIWIKEDNGWIEVKGTKNYPTKDGFIEDMSKAEDFTEAMRDYYKFNNQNNNEV